MASIKALRERNSLKRRIAGLIPEFKKICYRHDLPPLPEITASWRALSRGDHGAADRCVTELVTFSKQWLLSTVNGSEMSIVAQLRALLKREVAGAKALALTGREVTEVHNKSEQAKVTRSRRPRKRRTKRRKTPQCSGHAQTAVDGASTSADDVADGAMALLQASAAGGSANEGCSKAVGTTDVDITSTPVSPRPAMYAVTNVDRPRSRRTRKSEPRPAWSSSWRKEDPGTERSKSLRAKAKARLQRDCKPSASASPPPQNTVNSDSVAGISCCSHAGCSPHAEARQQYAEFKVPRAAELEPLNAPLDSISRMLSEPEPTPWQARLEFCHCVRQLVIHHASVLRLGVSAQSHDSAAAQSEVAPSLLARVCHIARATMLHGDGNVATATENNRADRGDDPATDIPWTAAVTGLTALTAVHGIYRAVSVASPQLIGADDDGVAEHDALVGGALLLLQPMCMHEALAVALTATAPAKRCADPRARPCLFGAKWQRAVSRVGELILDVCAACVPITTSMRCETHNSSTVVLRAVMQDVVRRLRVLKKTSHVAGSTLPCAQRRRQASLASASLARMARRLACCMRDPTFCNELDLHEQRQVVKLLLRIYRSLHALCGAENVRRATAAAGVAAVIGTLRAMAYNDCRVDGARSTAVVVFAQIHALANRNAMNERQARELIAGCVPPQVVKLGSFHAFEDEGEIQEPAAATTGTAVANDSTTELTENNKKVQPPLARRTADQHGVNSTPIAAVADKMDGKNDNEKRDAAAQHVARTERGGDGLPCESTRANLLLVPDEDTEDQVQAVLHEIVGTIDTVGGQLGLQPWSAGSAVTRASEPQPTKLPTRDTRPPPGYEWQAASRAMPAWTMPSMSKPPECADIED